MQIFFAPMACSLAARIAAYEADLKADFVQVGLHSKLTPDGRSFRDISLKGQVAALITDQGRLLTENAAVLQYLADRRPESHLAPPPASEERYELQAWLSFVGSEMHKQILWPIYNPGSSEDGKAYARSLMPHRLSYLNLQLADRPCLLGDDFTVADAYLVWALLLFQRNLGDLSAWPVVQNYLQAQLQRPAVARALAEERALLAQERILVS